MDAGVIEIHLIIAGHGEDRANSAVDTLWVGK